MRRLTLALALAALAACQTKAPTTPRSSVKPASVKSSPTPTAAPTTAPTASATARPTATPTSKATASPAAVASAATGSAAATGAAVLAVSFAGLPPDTWTNAPSLLRGRAGAVTGLIAGKPFVLAGEAQPTVELWNPDTGVWQLSTDLYAAGETSATGYPFGFRMAVGGVWHDEPVVAGGREEGATDVLPGVQLLLSASLASDHGIVLTPGVYAAAGGVAGDHLVVAGGLSALQTVSPLTQRVHLPDCAWEVGAPMPTPVAGAASAVVAGKVYALGGYTLDGGTPVASSLVQVYDPVADRWNPGPALGSARHSATAAVVDGHILIFGGVGADDKPLGTTESLDVATGRWKTLAPMPVPRALAGALVYEGRVWVSGGFAADKQPSQAVEVYQP